MIFATTTAAAFCLLGLAASAQAAPPTIANVTFSAVTPTSVILKGNINPQEKATLYHFEYGSADCAANPCTPVPVPDGELPKGNTPVSVSIHLEGLDPHTTYHFRLIAKSSGAGGGETPGPDRAFTTFATQPPFASCPNDALRTGGPSAALPDCRAYEQASPVEKNGLDATGTVPFVKATPSGDRISFGAANGIPGAEGGQELPVYLASRAPAGWSSQGLLPSTSVGLEAHILGWLPDFSEVFSETHTAESFQGGALYARSSSDGSLFPIIPYGEDSGGRYIAATPDGSLVFFYADGKLPGKAGIEGNRNIYVWNRDSGEIVLASVLPNGEPVGGALVGSYLAAGTPYTYNEDTHVVTDGGSIYFTVAGQLYLRKDAADPGAETIPVSVTHRIPPDPLGQRDADFQAATPDGKHVFFASPEELTNDANTGPVQPPPAIQSAKASGPPIESSLPIKASGIAIDSEYIYWASPSTDTIGRVKINGDEEKPAFIEVPPRVECPPGKPTSKPECSASEEVSVPAGPQYVAVDAGHIYWTNERSGYRGTGTIGRADINGDPESVEPSWIEGANRPRGIAVNSEHIYWANSGQGSTEDGTIGRADITGPSGSVEQGFIVSIGSDFPVAVALDAGHIYWTEIGFFNNESYVLSAEIEDGSNQKSKYLGVGAKPRGIAVAGGHVYWASQGAEAIGRLPLSGFDDSRSCEEICEKDFIPTEGKPIGLAADGTDLHWSINGEVSPNPGNDLYRFDVEGGSLTDISPDPDDENGAEVLGLLGSSSDGSYVYFAANGDLDGAGPASAGDCRSIGGNFESPQFAGHCSLYLARGGSIELVAPLAASGVAFEGVAFESDAVNWQTHGGIEALNSGQIEKSSRVSPDGRVLIFRSRERLSAYDNEGRPELYRYVAGQGAPRCISCAPSGAPPSGAFVQGVTVGKSKPEQPNYVLHRTLSADGDRVFFQSTDPLLPADTNGEDGCLKSSCQDVYEWEAEGTGSCEEDVQGGGCLYLLSSGKSINASYFGDASLSGDHVFLFTTDPLVGQDKDKLYDLYDAAAGGGLAGQRGFAASPCEGAEACHPAPFGAAPFPSPATPQFSGPPSPPPHRHKKPHKKRGKKHHHKHAGKHSKGGRGGS